MLTITAGLFVVYHFTKTEMALLAAMGIGLIGLTSKYLSNIIHIGWWKLTFLLSLVVPKIVLTLIYFIILLPVSLLARLTGRKDILRLKNTHSSNYQDINKTFNRSDFDKPW